VATTLALAHGRLKEAGQTLQDLIEIDRAFTYKFRYGFVFVTILSTGDKFSRHKAALRCAIDRSETSSFILSGGKGGFGQKYGVRGLFA